MDAAVEMRKVNRFPVEAPITFWWVENGIVVRGEGRTRDISEAGAFVFAGTCPAPGVEIGFKIFLPMIPGIQHRTRVEADGQVLRVEPPAKEGCGGFVILTQHTLLRVNSGVYERGEVGITSPN